MRLLVAAVLCALAVSSHTSENAGPYSQWVRPNMEGKLAYATTPTGDRIVDFSYAGYRGGGVALPAAPVAETLTPSGADDTAALQSALDRVAASAAKADTPQALLLAPGTFHLSAPVNISASNLVLRGSGRDKTIVQLTGTPHIGFILGLNSSSAAANPDEDSAASADKPGQTKTPHARTMLADTYIPSGTRQLPVASAEGFATGDTILIKHTITPDYLHFMGMDHLTRNGKDEHWVGSSITTERHIAAIRGNTLVLDVPITDDYDPRFGGGSATSVTAVRAPTRLHDSGIEALSLTAPSVSIPLDAPHFDAIHITSAEDVWLRDLDIRDTTNFIQVEAAARRVTIDRVDLTERKAITSPAKNFGFSLAGTQTLVLRSSAHANKLIFAATQARIQGPNVLLDCDFTGDLDVEPHQRWATGFLVDNVHVHGGAIHFINRGEMGSGHGWAIGWSVIWNSTADELVAQLPPGSVNWVIGSKGQRLRQPMPIIGARGADRGPDLPEAVYDSWNKPVEPRSLYLQQLADRLGPDAVKNIGY
ncbi:MAG TPA: hypothetical protein VFW30_01665 [Bryocella sp.]|nr:hypothetical protein [Bryocella sp.]